jgi:WhiB family redox-sensing transcriptional regulator
MKKEPTTTGRSRALRAVGTGSWESRAACLGMDTELFYPTGMSDAALAAAEKAKEICWGCPVRELCQQSAASRDVEFGVWGGVSEQERNHPQAVNQRLHTIQIREDARRIALDSGAHLLRASIEGQGEYRLADQYRTSRAVIRHALQILRPSSELRPIAGPLEQLMHRETELRQLVADGWDDEEIADRMNTDLRTAADGRRVLQQIDQAHTVLMEVAG